MTSRNQLLEDRLVLLAAAVCRIVGVVPQAGAGAHISKQLVRCGTSPAANYAEARGAESRKDFVHKMKLCLKELRETMVWLKLLRELNLATKVGLEDAIDESDQLVAIFVTSLNTAQRKEEPRL